MERTEPALVPEWLRSTGNAGGGTSARHSDVSSTVHSTQSRSFRSSSDKDSPRFLDCNPSFNSKHSNNGSTKHPYSSFTRSHRDKNRDLEKEKSLSKNLWDHDSFDPLSSILTSRVDKCTLMQSQSLVSRKPGEALSRRVEESKKGINIQNGNNGVLSSRNNLIGVQKTAFEKDFPSLGAEEKQGVTGIRSVLSPGLGSIGQSFPIGNSGFLGGEKWTSALAEVPDIVVANNGKGHSSLNQCVVTFSTSASGSSSMANLNMAKALSQSPTRVRAANQVPDKSQRLEELAIKQSRQLIPMTPSTPKPLVPSAADKLKLSKISKGVHSQQPVSPHLSNQSRAGQTKSDSSSSSYTGKFMVLKTGHENGTKDASGPIGDANFRVSNGNNHPPLTQTASTNSNNSTVSNKRPSQSLAKSRSEFFNLMRRKNLPNATTNSDVSSSGAEEEIFKDHAKENSCVLENCNGHDILDKSKNCAGAEEKLLPDDGVIDPDEEETAFLRSLGWEENGGEDEGLTEEEINAFYQEYMTRRPSLEVSRSTI